jgi:FKBP-type peptidyl-prolyl cis-trans isomerase
MKSINYLLIVFAVVAFTTGCKNVSYKKTKSGLLYKIFPSNGKGELMKIGNVAKYNVTYRLNDDSLLYSSYGKAPAYDNVREDNPAAYNISEIFTMMKKGDSAVTVQFFDSLIKRGAQIPFPTNKGDRLVTHLTIIEVFASDSTARPDYNAEMEKDKPRQMKEQAEQMAKAQKQEEEQMEKTKKERDEQQLKEIEQWEKSGEVGKELKEMERWLAAKKINAQKTGKGTYVFIQQQGTGPAAEPGKYVNIKYTGKVLATDSTFQTATYAIKLGTSAVIRGWTEGLQLFKQGGKGTIYIPGFLAWGANPGPAGKPFAPVLFDVEILEVSDKPIAQQQPQQ